MSEIGNILAYIVLMAAIAGGIALAGFGLSWSLRYLLGPLNEAAISRAKVKTFQITDLFSLTLLIQIPLGLAAYVSAQAGKDAGVMMAVIFGAAVVLMWRRALSVLSHAGVSSTLRRAVFVLVVTPVAWVGVITAFGTTITLIVRALSGAQQAVVVIFTMIGVFAAIIYGCRRLSIWVAR